MMTTVKVLAVAVLAFSAGGLATYETLVRVHVTAACARPVVSDDGMKAFLAKPDAPLTGYPRY